MHVLHLVHLSVGKAAFSAPHSTRQQNANVTFCEVITPTRVKIVFLQSTFHLCLLPRAKSAARCNLEQFLWLHLNCRNGCETHLYTSSDLENNWTPFPLSFSLPPHSHPTKKRRLGSTVPIKQWEFSSLLRQSSAQSSYYLVEVAL